MTRPDNPDVARAVTRHSHNPCKRPWVVAEKILVSLDAKRDLGITNKRDSRLSFTIFADTDYAASKTTDRRSISGVM